MLRIFRMAASTGAAFAVLAGGNVSAQWFGRGADCNCGAAPVTASMVAASYAAPTVTACNVCAPVVQTVCAPAVQPVMQTVYRQVPVTELQPAEETVRRQVFETKYVSQEVTAYRPITETKVAEVPTVSYQNVTECQTQYRNAGYWRTRCDVNPKCSPCQVDSRPGLAGWFNRTSYEMMTAFQPTVRTTREYVPQTVAVAVPVTRQVAVPSARQVTYNVTRMEPYKTTQQVAVSVPRWEEHKVTVMKPVTVVKTMAVGTQVAYVPIGAAGTATALGPTPDTIGGANGSRRADLLKESDPSKVNDKTRSAAEPTAPHTPASGTPISIGPRSSATASLDLEESPLFAEDFVDLGRAQPLPFPSKLQFTAAKPAHRPATVAPGAARAAQWVARSAKSPSMDPAPSAVSLADTVRP